MRVVGSLRSGIKSGWTLAIAVGLSIFALGAADAQAQAIQLPSNRLFETTSGGKKVSCGQLDNGKWVSGVLKKDGESFTTHAAQIKKLNKQIKTAPAEKLTTLQSKLAKLKVKKRTGTSACKAGPGGGGGPSPTPTSGPGATPTPAGCFQGNVTTCFGIPSGVSGDSSRGLSIWIGMSCQSCHSTSVVANRTFNQVQAAFSTQPQMLLLPQLTTQQAADVTALLNK